MADDIDESNPQDSDIVSQFPANERASRKAISNIIGKEHSNTTGRHKIFRGTESERDAITDWETGSLAINTDATPERLEHNKGTKADPDWVPTGGEFSSGVKLIFPQASAPTGWTQDTAVNDKVLRIVDDTGTGGDTGGDWEISGLTVDGHTLTVSEIPSHTHGPGSYHVFKQSGTGSGAIQADGAGSNQTVPVLGTSGATGGGGSHTHGLSADGDWRPAYLDAIIAAKD